MKKYPGWYYNEFQQIGADFADETVVDGYDERMNQLRDLDTEMNTIRQALDLQSHQTLLEFGTGTGELPARLAGNCRHVIAVDISETMLNAARRKAERNGRNNVQFVQAGFLTYEHQGEPVDAVVSQMALHHLPDFWKWLAFRKIFNVLRPGGHFYYRDVVFSSEVTDYEPVFTALIEGIQEKVGENMGQAMERHIRQEYSTLDWIIEGMLDRVGFTLLEKRVQQNYMGCFVCVKK